MITVKKSGLLCLIVVFTLTHFGCVVTTTPTVYPDPPYHAPYFDDDHESKVSFITAGFKGTGMGGGVKFSHLFPGNIIVGYQHIGARRPEVTYGDEVISDTDSVGNEINYYELALGYNYPWTRPVNVELFTGLGIGNLSATYAGDYLYAKGEQQLKTRFSTRYFRPFIQANLVCSIPYVEAGVMGRLAYIRTIDAIQSGEENQFTEGFIGYGYFIRLGSEKFQFDVQGSWAHPLLHTVDSKYYTLRNGSLGLSVMLVR